jgi:hypothetical protein
MTMSIKTTSMPLKQLSKSNNINNSQRQPTPQKVSGKENNTSTIEEKKTVSKLSKIKISPGQV